MSKNMIYADIASTRRVIPVPTGTAPGTALIHGGKAHVTITGSGDYDTTTVLPNGITVSRVNVGGVGLGPLQATAAVTGSFAFNVTGASASTTPGTAVYITSGGTLTLTSTGNTAFGIVDFFRGDLSATDTVVKIGV